jgi:peptidyl-prolyl cis-trans isomerase NIMA-interacting 1
MSGSSAFARVFLPILLVAACDKPPSDTTRAPVASSASGTTSAASVAAPAPLPEASPPTQLAAAPDAIIAQHILVAYRGAKRAPKGVTRTKAQAKVRAGEALAKVRGGAPFEDVVKEYSDDAGSADRLGSVGKFRREDMDPAFSAAAFALRVGQVSDVVQTPFGFHVIKRTQ